VSKEPQIAEQSRDAHPWVLSGLVVGVIAISFAAIFFRKTAPTHPLVAAGTRLAIAAVLLAPWTLRSALKGKLQGRYLACALGAGAFYGLHFGAWVSSLTMTSVAASVTIVTSTPLILAVWSLCTGKDKPQRAHWLAMALALVGLGIIGGADMQSQSSNLAGDGLAFLGAVAMAGYLLLARSLGRDLDPLAFTGFATIVGAGTLFAAGAIMGIPWEIPSTTAWKYLLLAALIPQMIGHTLLTWALRHVSPTTVGLSTVGEPVGAAILAWIWLEESVGAFTAIGCSVTLFAVIVGVRAAPAPAPEESTGATDSQPVTHNI